jgi:hypothetical protein
MAGLDPAVTEEGRLPSALPQQINPRASFLDRIQHRIDRDPW